MKQRIKQVIVVEGRDDAANIKRFVDAEIIITHGFAISAETYRRIAYAASTVGIIILTDPDFAGERIRKDITKRIKGNLKQAYISRAAARKGNDIGVENAGGEAIVTALANAKAEVDDVAPIYTQSDIVSLGLAGRANSKALRIAVGEAFHIGYANAKQLLQRLNKYQVDKTALARFIKSFQALGSMVTVTIDRPCGSTHPNYCDLKYPLNYGYIDGILADDGEAQDAYILGETEPLTIFTGKVIAIVRRIDDNEDKWVVAADQSQYDCAAIYRQVVFQEHFFNTEIIMLSGCLSRHKKMTKRTE